MESSQLCLLILGLIVAVGIHIGSAINCYECNSKYDVECDDPDKLKNTPKLLKKCDEVAVKNNITEGYKYCRKYTQDIEGEWRVIRQCATDGREDSCYERAGTQGIQLKYCYCGKDGCNTASAVFTPLTFALGVITSFAALLLHS